MTSSGNTACCLLKIIDTLSRMGKNTPSAIFARECSKQNKFERTAHGEEIS
ncbi:MAG: hypothetical protein AB1461_11425 [Thermodesulfobacteriota bacterium]